MESSNMSYLNNIPDASASSNEVNYQGRDPSAEAVVAVAGAPSKLADYNDASKARSAYLDHYLKMKKQLDASAFSNGSTRRASAFVPEAAAASAATRARASMSRLTDAQAARDTSTRARSSMSTARASARSYSRGTLASDQRKEVVLVSPEDSADEGPKIVNIDQDDSEADGEDALEDEIMPIGFREPPSQSATNESNTDAWAQALAKRGNGMLIGRAERRMQGDGTSLVQTEEDSEVRPVGLRKSTSIHAKPQSHRSTTGQHRASPPRQTARKGMANEKRRKVETIKDKEKESETDGEADGARDQMYKEGEEEAQEEEEEEEERANKDAVDKSSGQGEEDETEASAEQVRRESMSFMRQQKKESHRAKASESLKRKHQAGTSVSPTKSPGCIAALSAEDRGSARLAEEDVEASDSQLGQAIRSKRTRMALSPTKRARRHEVTTNPAVVFREESPLLTPPEEAIVVTDCDNEQALLRGSASNAICTLRAAKQLPGAAPLRAISGLHGSDHFKPIVGPKTGGPLHTDSTQGRSADTTWEHLELPFAGPAVGAQAPEQQSSRIENFTPSNQRARDRAGIVMPSSSAALVGKDSQAAPRVGRWLVPAPMREVPAQVTYDENMDSDGIESGDDLDVLKAMRTGGQARLIGVSGLEDDMSPSRQDGRRATGGLQVPGYAPPQSLPDSSAPAVQDSSSPSAGPPTAAEPNAQQHVIYSPTSKIARHYVAEQVEASPHVPVFFKQTVIEFVIDTPSQLEDSSLLKEKESWFIELGSLEPPDELHSKLGLIIETSPPSFTVQIMGKQIAQMLSSNWRHSPWYDALGHRLDSKTGKARPGSSAPVSMEEHMILQRKYDRLLEDDVIKEDLVEAQKQNIALRAKLNGLQADLTHLQAEAKANKEAITKTQNANAKLTKERDTAKVRSSRLRAQHDGIVLHLKGIHGLELRRLQGDNDRLKAQLQLFIAQHTRTDDAVRRKAAEYDKLREREADQESARQRHAEQAEKALQATREKLLATVSDPAVSAEDKRRAMFQLAAMGGKPSAVAKAPDLSAAPATPAGGPAPTPATAKELPSIDDELAGLADEAAMAESLGDSGCGGGGGGDEGYAPSVRRSRRRAAPRRDSPQDVSRTPAIVDPPAGALAAGPIEIDDDVAALMEENEQAEALDAMLKQPFSAIPANPPALASDPTIPPQLAIVP